MHSFLYPNPPDLPENPDVLHVHPNPSIGIEEVRAVQHFLSRKPSQSNQNTVIIHNAEKLTLPAQHALLKTLEEPPGNSLIYLVTSYPDSLLPTILSRVQIAPSVVIPSVVEESLSDLFRQLLSAPPTKRLALLDSQNFTHDAALKFLEDMEYFVHNQIQNNSLVLSTSRLALIYETRKYLKSNCSVKLALDHLALNFISLLNK